MSVLRFAFRSLRKSPGFTAVAVLALALGIGANSAIFSLVQAIFLRPLPYAEAERIVQLTSTVPERQLNRIGFSWPRFEAVRERQQVFSDLAVSIGAPFTVTGAADPEQVVGLMVSANYFSLLGAKAELGRTFLPEEDRPGGAPVVVLSHRYWQDRFAGRQDAIGESLTLDGTPCTIVGVLPERLSSFPLNQVALFTARPFEAPFLARSQIDGGGFFFTVYARLKPGVQERQVRAAMDVIAATYAQSHPTNADAKSQITVGALLDDLVGDQRQTYATLFAAVAAVLLIACANVANLVLARFSRRGKELGIRSALGARRGQIVAQLVAENVMLALAGGACGLLLAALALRVVARAGANFIPRAGELSLDPAVLGFTLGLSLLVGVVLGVVTALQAATPAIADELRSATRGSTADRRRNGLRSALLVAEIAASFVLLIVTGLLISSFLRLRNVQPGFRTEGIFTGFLVVPPAQYPPRTEGTANFYARLYHRLQAIPGARQVALSDNPPLSGNNGQSPYAVVGRPLPPPSERPLAIRHLVSPNRFALLGIPLLAGRDFDEHDTPASAPVIIINQAMAKQLFGNESPLGQKLVTGMLGLTAEVVGVVADTHTTSLAAPPVPEMYYPVLQRPENFTGILIRTDGDPLALTGAVRAALREVDAGIPLTNPGTMARFLAQSTADRQLTMNLLIVFAGLALVLATLGVYSVMAYSVAQRSAEIGIRMTLGASAAAVQKMVLRQAMALTGIGLGIGVLGALALTRTMTALLFEVGASDPLVYVAIAVLLALVAALACWIPSRRAARVDPVKALQIA